MRKIALKYAFWMLAGFTGLFILMHVLGLSDRHHLRVLNGFIHFGFIYLAIRDYRRENPASMDNYVSGVAIGMYSSIVAVALFALGMSIYLGLNQPFFERLRDSSPWPEFFTPVTASLFIFTEGIMAGVIGSYIITRVIDAQLEKRKV